MLNYQRVSYIAFVNRLAVRPQASAKIGPIPQFFFMLQTQCHKPTICTWFLNRINGCIDGLVYGNHGQPMFISSPNDKSCQQLPQIQRHIYPLVN